MFRETFDFVVSLGADCACSSLLKDCDLRSVAGPFDGIGREIPSFEANIDLICTRFEGFLVQERLRLMDDSEVPFYDKLNSPYEDRETFLRFVHDVPRSETLDRYFPKLKERYDRRIERLYRMVEESERVLFVWRETRESTSDERFLAGQARLAAFFGKDVRLLCLTQKAGAARIEETVLSPSVVKFAGDYIGDRADSFKGNRRATRFVFRKIRVPFRLRAGNFIRRILATILPALMPTRRLRNAVRKRILRRS